MHPLIKVIPVGAVLALTMASVSAQTTAPAPNASAPTTTLGVSPQDAAKATQQAVPRSDTGTVVRTSPSPASRASDVLNGNTAGNAGTTAGTSPGTNAGTSAMRSDGTATGTRRARADRN